MQPGGIDTHVHLEEPALFGGKGSSSDNFETGQSLQVGVESPRLTGARNTVEHLWGYHNYSSLRPTSKRDAFSAESVGGLPWPRIGQMLY